MHINVENSSSMNKLESLINNKADVIVLYFGSWCHFCVEFKDTWNSFVKIAKINTAQIESAHNGLSSSDRHSVSSYPTLKLFTNGKMIPFFEERSVESLVNFVKKNVKSNSKTSAKPKTKSITRSATKSTTKSKTKSTTKKLTNKSTKSKK